MQKTWAALMSLLLLLVAACAPSATTPSPAQPTAPTPTAETAGSAGVDAAAQAVSWLGLPLVNARTGETFTFADFSGKTVLARTVGTW